MNAYCKKSPVFCIESVIEGDVSVRGLRFGSDGGQVRQQHLTVGLTSLQPNREALAGWIGYNSVSIILVPARQDHVKTANGL